MILRLFMMRLRLFMVRAGAPKGRPRGRPFDRRPD
jgi:hypothetical protein